MAWLGQLAVHPTPHLGLSSADQTTTTTTTTAAAGYFLIAVVVAAVDVAAKRSIEAVEE